MPASRPHDSREEFAKTETVVASAARTASGNSSAVAGYGPIESIRAQLNVTASSGSSPTLDVTIEDSLDGTNWNTVGTFTQKTTTGRQVINVAEPFSDNVRVKWVIGGSSPSFTFDVVLSTELDD